MPDPERLWSPWRMEYIRRGEADREDGGCVFCDLPAADPSQDEANHLLARGEVCFLLLNAFPYNPGHLMAAPYRHVGEYEELTADELAEMMALTGRAIRAMRKASGPHGFNLGMNLGEVAGAGIADHLHLHLVPRWGGDTNFMPVIGHTKVLPELLNETYQRLHPHFTQVGVEEGPPVEPS